MDKEETFQSNHYKKEDKKTLAEVIIFQIDFCRKEFSKELKGSYHNQIQVDGVWMTVSIPDQRETNINSTKTLYNLMKFYFDETFEKEYKKFLKLLDNSNEIFLKKYIKEESNKYYKDIAKETNKIPNNKHSSLSENIMQRLFNYRSDLYRELFSDLILLFKRKYELSGKRVIKR